MNTPAEGAPCQVSGTLDTLDHQPAGTVLDGEFSAYGRPQGNGVIDRAYLPTAAGMSEERQQFLEFRYGTKLQLQRTGFEALGAQTDMAFSVGGERAGVDDHDFQRLLIEGIATTGMKR